MHEQEYGQKALFEVRSPIYFRLVRLALKRFDFAMCGLVKK
jgi:hypothetical protein